MKSMRKLRRRGALAAGLALAALAVWSSPGAAADFRAGELVVSAPWARATPGGIKVGAAYLTLTNRGAKPDRLLGAQTSVAERVELHTTVTENGMMRMRAVDSVAVAPGQTVRFEPATGLHLMLINLAAPLQQGGTFTLQLTFEQGGKIEVPVAIGGVGAADAPADAAAVHNHQ